MASAAAVGVDAARSPIHNTIGEDGGLPGEVTSAIHSRDDAIETNGDLEEDEDDDIRGTAKRRGPVDAAASGDQEDGADENGDGDDLNLFGEEDEELPERPARRQLDDEELDSGDDVGRTDRQAEEPAATQEQQYETVERAVMDLEIARQPVPEPSDGEMYLLKVPDFMSIEPHAWDHKTFNLDQVEQRSDKPASAYNEALGTIRWRHSPSDPKQLQSNARVLRWSDGSLTLQMASNPIVQYEIDGNSLAPPQRNPLKPTPVSTASKDNSKAGRQGDGTVTGERYDSSKDAYTYLVVPNEQVLRTTHKITAALMVRQPDNIEDDAIEQLRERLANAANATKVSGVGGGEVLELVDEDPEKARLEAEKSMREVARQRKKQENAQEREEARARGTLGRSGLTSSRYGAGGLSAGMLEDDEGMTTSRGRKTGATPKKSRRRRNSIYSEDEDFGRRGFNTREDEYDEDDDFLARSDEEEVVEDDDDPDDGIVEEPRERRVERERTPKRDREDDEADAEGEEVDEDVAATRTKRRRVVDEDEDEE